MALGLMLFIFLIILILVSISPLSHWRLKDDEPLHTDDHKWPAFGYGSAAISLNCLFGAYSATLLLMGYACFAGVILGVVTGLFSLDSWIRRLDVRPGFQPMLYNLHIFESAAVDKLFWFLLIFCQLGLALSELLLLRHVFAIGLGFSQPHAIAATLFIACVAYYYCLIGGYHALFRTDALQYILIVLMGTVLLALLWRLSSSSIALPALREGVQENLYRPVLPDLFWRYPLLRYWFEALAGFALGIMPVICAPDAWKRILIVRRNEVLRREKEPYHDAPPTPKVKAPPTLARIGQSLRTAPLRLLLATAVPIGLITPLLLGFSREGIQDEWSFPVKTLLALSPDFLDGFIILGMTAAFMSTFDSAHLSATHVMLGQRIFPPSSLTSEIQRYRVLFGGLFAILVLVFLPAVDQLAHPYVLGATLVGPFALVSGLLMGTRLGKRKIKGDAIVYIIVLVLGLWVLLVLDYISTDGTAANPYLALPLVSISCCFFFLIFSCARILTRRGTTP